jgi:uncharacterized membrane protein
MKRKGLIALLGIVAGLAILAAVAIVAYNFGVNTGDNGGHAVFGPMMRGYRGGYFGLDGGWWGIVPAVLFGFVIVLVVWALLGGTRRSATTQAPGPSGESAAGLRELVEMHDRGALTDDEFTAAKRKLLGL